MLGILSEQSARELPSEIRSIRTGCSAIQPIVMLGTLLSEQVAVGCFRAGADAYLDLTMTTTEHLLWQLAQASERQKLLEENQRLEQFRHQHSQRESEEARSRWQEQLTMLGDTMMGPESFREQGDSPVFDPNLMGYYREVLQTQIIMGSGKLSEEVRQLGDLLVTEGMTADSILRMHLVIVQDTMEELGSRSARHVMNRADTLVIDLLCQVADRYRGSSLQNVQTPAHFSQTEWAQVADKMTGADPQNA